MNVRWWEKNSGVQKLQGSNKPIRKTNKKVATFFFFFFFFLETVKMLYFVGAPFEFSGRAPFKLVTLLVGFLFFSFIL